MMVDTSARHLTVILLSATLLTSCVTDGVNKQTIGTAGGAILGGLAGSQFGKGKGNVFATIAGAAAGAWLGNQLGAYLDEQDRASAAAAVQKAAITGQPQSWSNPQTGVQGKVEVVAAPPRQDVVPVKVEKAKVEKLPPLDLINKPYKVVKNANLRAGPGTDKPVVGSLPAGMEVVAVGKAKGTDWFLISENGVGTGFVSGTLIQPAGIAPPAPAAKPATSTPPAPNVEVQQVAATRNCRTLQQTIMLANGKEHKENVTSCEGPDGWEVVA